MMKVQTNSLSRGITVRFELKDFAPEEQRELLVMSLRELGFIEVLSKEAIAEIDAHLLTLSKQ